MPNTAAALETQIRAHRLMQFPVAWSDELIFPYYHGLSLPNVVQSVAQMLGVNMGGVGLDSAVWGGPAPEGIGRVVLLLVDGAGYLWLKKLMNDDPEIAALIARLSGGKEMLPLTSICPSTTAVAMPTLWTGLSPAAHGMLGTVMYLREFSMLGDMLGYKPATGKHNDSTFEDWGKNPETFVAQRGLSEYLETEGIPTHLLTHYQLNGTGLSRILHRGVRHRYTHLGYGDVWLRLRALLQQTVGQRCVVTAYYPNVDSLAHAYGADNAFTRSEIKTILTQFAAILNEPSLKDGQTLVMILADHGHYDSLRPVDVWQDEHTAPLRDALRCGMGAEMRLPFVYVRAGKSAQVIQAIERHYADCLTWVEGEAALEAGLFGSEPPDPETVFRVGDIVLIPRLGWRVVEPTIDFPGVSLHGGLSDWEMLVPFLWHKI